MAQDYEKAYFEWIRLAEEAVKSYDYESAAQLMRYVSTYFGLINDISNQKRFIKRAGDCYLQAAKKAEGANRLSKAISLYIKAAKCFRESEYKELVQTCDSMIRKHHETITKDSSILCEIISDLKSIGDYFREINDNRRALECYSIAAEKAYEQRKIALSGSLHLDVGDCSHVLKDFEKAAENYGKAASKYFECQMYLQAAKYYCESGFLYIHASNLAKASIMAEKAEVACAKGQIDFFLKDLILICQLLSRRDLQRATEYWSKIRRKFKSSYAELIDSSFRVVSRMA